VADWKDSASPASTSGSEVCGSSARRSIPIRCSFCTVGEYLAVMRSEWPDFWVTKTYGSADTSAGYMADTWNR